MATYSYTGRLMAEAYMRGRTSMRGRLIALGGLGARVQQRAGLRAAAALVGEVDHLRPVTVTPRLQTVESRVEVRD